MISTFQYQQMLARLGKNSVRDAPVADAVESESDLHQQIMAECAQRGFLAVHSRMDAATTLSKGVPDFMVLADKGRLIIVECKSKTGKLTREQAAWIMMAEKVGHKVHVVRSFREFVELL